mmetsp:Transcript_2589/g.8254  ORF Transcript_2589/g.8254 Transcript_2589/m.8254 type:complete len:300 (+) Transcript_2589:1964-2863(+)
MALQHFLQRQGGRALITGQEREEVPHSRVDVATGEVVGDLKAAEDTAPHEVDAHMPVGTQTSGTKLSEANVERSNVEKDGNLEDANLTLQVKAVLSPLASLSLRNHRVKAKRCVEQLQKFVATEPVLQAKGRRVCFFRHPRAAAGADEAGEQPVDGRVERDAGAGRDGRKYWRPQLCDRVDKAVLGHIAVKGDGAARNHLQRGDGFGSTPAARHHVVRVGRGGNGRPGTKGKATLQQIVHLLNEQLQVEGLSALEHVVGGVGRLANVCVGAGENGQHVPDPQVHEPTVRRVLGNARPRQ